ncbi:MAG: 5-(carboxyamino)imidazole ribonucleotide mutase [Spirochaetales bacterium]|jgi:5-(carboxyamino)imidazole ribonucleotide mutase|nr:5-(carboxyamino)imidazole ribonucleotide mutase [Spirochaetales bacterium]
MNTPAVGIIMGSDSDFPVMKEAAQILDAAGAPFELTIVSAHRTPERLFRYARSAAERGLKVIIAGAGGAAHLPGMTASLTRLPVIGVPVRTTAFSGLDSLLSIVQMPSGVPVATMAVNGAKNAGLLALRILGLSDPRLSCFVEEEQERQRAQAEAKGAKFEAGDFSGFAEVSSFAGLVTGTSV